MTTPNYYMAYKLMNELGLQDASGILEYPSNQEQPSVIVRMEQTYVRVTSFREYDASGAYKMDRHVFVLANHVAI
jgi:hypothetical protein